MFSESLLRPVENLINRGIAQSTEATKLCRQLDGRSMDVTIDVQPFKTPLNLRVTANDDQIHMSDESSKGADVEISGTMMELNRLMFSGSQLPLRNGRVVIHGDTDIAEQFRMLFLLARPNLEEELVDLVGDDAAPRIAKAVRNLRSLMVGTLEDVAEQVSDYLREDGNHLPTRAETENFFDDVDKLPNDIARIEARLSRVREKLEEHEHGND